MVFQSLESVAKEEQASISWIKAFVREPSLIAWKPNAYD